MLTQIHSTELSADVAKPYSSHTTTSPSKKDNYSTLNRSYSNESITLRPGFIRQKSNERPKSALEIRDQNVSKPPIAHKPAVPPPPPPIAPIVLPPKPTVAAKQIKGKKPNVPLTAVRQGLITVDALQAKKGKLKAVKASDSETPKTSKSIPNLVGKLAGHGGKPTPMFGGNLHSNVLAKAVAARAARLASEAHESENSESPSSWEDESQSPTIPYNTNLQKQRPVTPKKTPPPVPPKKRSPTPRHRPMPSKTEMDSPTRRRLYPPYINELSPERLSSFATEEDRTMMLFDDVLRKEVESESWSLSSWNSSDSSTAADIIAPPSFPGNGYDERKSSIGSSTRPWYEYSSGSPSEDSLNASTERISQVRPSLSQELQNAEGRTNFDSEKIAEERRRRFSNGDENAMINGKRYPQVKTTASDSDIHFNSIVQAFSQPNLSSKDNSVSVDSKDSVDTARQGSHDGDNVQTHKPEKSQKSDITNTDIDKGDTSPTVTSVSDEETKTECKRDDTDGLVEQIFTTSTGVQIKLRLQPKRKPPTSQSDAQSTNPEPPPHIENTVETSKQDYPKDITSVFIPPPPLDFHGETFDDIPSPALPPPPEFSPMHDSSEVFSPLPAPPMDFCDNDADHGSVLDTPSELDEPAKG